MNTKYIFGIVAAIVLVGAIFLIYNQNSENDNLANETSTAANSDREPDVDRETTDTASENANMPTNSSGATAPAEQGQLSTGEPTAPQNPDIAVFEITYNGSIFSPSELSIKTGDIVIFKNESDKSFWPASGPHPQHTNYPEFDPKKAITAGQSWQFTFAKAGSWPFHDHLNSSVFGKITVQ